MTRVIFYVNVADLYGFLQRFLQRKVFLHRQKALIYAPEAVIEQLDCSLWEQFFLPHQRLTAPQDEEAAAPIMLTSEMPPPEYQTDMLISLAAEVPTAFAGRFDVFIDVVGSDEASRKKGRARFRYFKDHGYSLEVIDMGAKSPSR